MKYYLYQKSPFAGADMEYEIESDSKQRAIDEIYQDLKGYGWDKDLIAESIVGEDEI